MRVPMSVRAAILDRDGHRCLRCRADLMSRPYSIHHRKPRGMGGTSDERCNDPRNLVSLCGSGVTGCHGEIESNRAVAREDGWLISSFDHLDMPMLRKNGSRVRLMASGGLISWTTEDLAEAT